MNSHYLLQLFLDAGLGLKASLIRRMVSRQYTLSSDAGCTLSLHLLQQGAAGGFRRFRPQENVRHIPAPGVTCNQLCGLHAAKT